MSRRFAFAIFSSACFTYAQTGRVFNVAYTTPIPEVAIQWTSSATPHTIELRNFSPDATPIVHLLESERRQVAYAVAKGSELLLSVDGKTAGAYTLVIRSQKSTSVQTADLYVDGKLMKSKLEFAAGGAFAMARLASTEQVVGIRGPQGRETHVAYLISPDGFQILGRASGSTTTLKPALLQDAIVVLGSNKVSGPLRLYRNDLNRDTDEDGLGDGLEGSIGTCASNTGSVAGVNCNEIADPRDTDGDGLPDGWEVLGKLSGWYENGVFLTEYLALPAWGADPRHKDIFVEVDFRRLNLSENQSGLMLKMPPTVAKQMAATYADAATTDFFLKAAHAVSVNNPDRLPGINLHLDTGMNPIDPADATIYGNWGGYNAVDAVQNANGEWVPQRPEQVWKQQMSWARQGVFHYVMGYASGGGACGGGIACGFNFNDAGNSSHEFGHTLGLNHNGPYGIHEPNCKPNYPSLMNYAYLQHGYRQFSDGLKYPILNNYSLSEANAVNPANTMLMDVLETTYGYKVDRNAGSVDWNRDGSFAAAGSTVRAYANYQPGNCCEYTREEMVSSGLQSEASPAVVYFRNKLLIFALGLDGQVRFTYTTGTWNCPTNIDNCPDPVFAPPIPLPIGPMLSVDAKVFRVNSNLEQILVAGIRYDGSVVEIPVVLDSGGYPAWGTITAISGAGAAIGELTLAVSQAKTFIAMVYKGPDHTVRYRSRSASGWSAETQLLASGSPIKMHPNTSPGLAFTGLPLGIAFGEYLVGAFTDGNGLVQLYTPGRIGQGWGKIPIPYDSMYSPVGRPVVGWVGSLGGIVATSDVPSSSLSSAANRFYILYLEYQTPPGSTPTNAVRMAMSYVDTAGTFRIGLGAYFDNVWAFAYGMGLVQPSDGALRAVVTSGVPSSLRTVHFRPQADGMRDLPYRNYDDWKTLGWGSCSTVAPTQTTMFIQCSAPW